jgi:predicted nucleotidyltransferase
MSTANSNIKQAVLDAIGIQPDIRLAILFGSLATGRMNPESDLDLAIDAGHPLTAGEKKHLMEMLAVCI